MSTDNHTEIDDLNFYSLLAVLQSGMWLQSDFENFLVPFGLSHSRFSILLAILHSSRGELFGNQLATRLGVAKSTIAKMVAKLIDEKLVECIADTNDSRRKRYSLTQKAIDLLETIVPKYLERIREMLKRLSEGEKMNVIELLSKIDFLHPDRTIIKGRTKTITDRARDIRTSCNRGSTQDIDRVLEYLTADIDIPTTKVVDFYLGTVTNPEGVRRIEYYLFHGTQIQRNYCTLFFSRKNEWQIVNKAYGMGLIDAAQAYSR
jgi:DNA-binding MarR family transcriptional regulator